MLPWLSLFSGCLQNRRAQRIYLLDPSHKDNEGWGWAHPASSGLPGTSRVTGGETRFSFPPTCSHYCASGPSLAGLRVSDRTVLDVCSGRTKQLVPVNTSTVPPFSNKWCCRTAFAPGLGLMVYSLLSSPSGCRESHVVRLLSLTPISVRRSETGGHRWRRCNNNFLHFYLSHLLCFFLLQPEI